MLRVSTLDEVLPLFQRHHGYASLGKVATYVWAWFELDEPVAAWVWNPPAPGAARALSPLAPHGVLSLSRMVAVNRSDRALRHISKPLRQQMRHLIDRGRWPVLATWSDASLGHTGHVYKCSGWQIDGARSSQVFTNESGERRSKYRAGHTNLEGLARGEDTTITRWVHRVVPAGEEAAHMAAAGWVREPIPGKVWASGGQAFRIVHRPPAGLPLNPKDPQ
jgi:hypothetical protein